MLQRGTAEYIATIGTYVDYLSRIGLHVQVDIPAASAQKQADFHKNGYGITANKHAIDSLPVLY